VFIGVWLAIHIGFGIYCPWIAGKEKQKLTMDTKQLESILRDQSQQNDGAIAHKMKGLAEDINKINQDKQWCSGVAEAVFQE